MQDSPEGTLNLTISDSHYKTLSEKLKEDGIELGDYLGKGSYSVVLKATMTQNGNTTPTAVKIIDTRKANTSEYVRRFLPREISIVRSISNEYILTFIKVYDKQDIPSTPFTTFVTELAEGGDLLKKIKKQKRFSENEAKAVFRQLLEALMYLAEKNIIHRDLKCENIMLDKSENVKLGDFGFARYLLPGEKSSTFCGSRAYVAPEIVRSVEYTGHAVDVWSSGIVLFIIVAGVMPYDERYPKKMLEKQLTHMLKFPRGVPLSKPVRRLIYEILHPNPTERPTYKQICASPWMEGATLQPTSTVTAAAATKATKHEIRAQG